MRTEKKMIDMGSFGEELVKTFFELQGHIVHLSEDKYDSKKDMVIDGKTCEVKTQMPFHQESAFSFKQNQLRKIQTADMFVCVEAPSGKSNWKIRIWEFPKDARKPRTRITKDGRNMFLIDMNKGAILTTVLNEDINKRMIELSNSEWKK
jgi:hypothetical protein